MFTVTYMQFFIRSIYQDNTKWMSDLPEWEVQTADLSFCLQIFTVTLEAKHNWLFSWGKKKEKKEIGRWLSLGAWLIHELNTLSQEMPNVRLFLRAKVVGPLTLQ